LAGSAIGTEARAADPVLHVLAGPNGSGKSTFYNEVLAGLTRLPFVNADLIARDRWPGQELEHGYDAAAVADQARDAMITRRSSFITETVFSHPSRVDLVARAIAAGYRVTLHVLLIPEDLATARVADRVAHGGHAVPEDRIRQRYRRLWGHVARAIALVHTARVYDNSLAEVAFRVVAVFHDGKLVGSADWPAWTPAELLQLGA
jgi:predicted ABC-type ATPase